MSELPFKSAVDGIAWPAVPGARGAAMLGVLFQLEQTQWLRPACLRARQYAQLRLLVDHARRTVPFYVDRLPALSDDVDSGLGEARLRVPLLTRMDIQGAGDALVAASIPPSHGAMTEIFTSGSVGAPIRSVRTQLWELLWSALTVRDHLWHRRDFAGTLAAIRESGAGKALYPNGTRTEQWGSSTGELFSGGPTTSLNVTTPIEQQVEWLVHNDPDYLLSHPTIIERLAAHCLTHAIRLPRLRHVEAISEVLPARVRALVRAAWGVPIVDVYSAREAGYICRRERRAGHCCRPATSSACSRSHRSGDTSSSGRACWRSRCAWSSRLR